VGVEPTSPSLSTMALRSGQLGQCIVAEVS
jgi:hypothetical protein